MAEMLVVLVLYSMWASAVLVWSTLLDEGRELRPQMSPGGVEYVSIPDHSFFELAAQHSNLVIFDVHAGCGTRGWSELISYWLTISAVDLPRVLKWLPPASRVVFCCKNATEQLDAHTKTILLQLGIGTIYFLGDGPVFQENRCSAPVTTRDAKRRATI
jgi:hypothetical protein